MAGGGGGCSIEFGDMDTFSELYQFCKAETVDLYEWLQYL
jgi:hypothetical protein